MATDQTRKWDNASVFYDFFNCGAERRYGKFKKDLYAKSRGHVLLVAAGTGLDFEHFPPGLTISAIDFSPKMVAIARKKAEHYNGKLDVIKADVTALEFPDENFDTVVTSCTFCSVPDPLKGLKEIRRVMRFDGLLLMFEHVRPGNFLLGAMMDIMTPLSRLFGPEMNRRTTSNVRRAGFRITREFNIYLDMVKLIEAEKQL